MTTPLPWSHSALEQFKNCPRQYHACRVEKSVVETKGEATIWGEEVHKHFEEFLAHGVVLPPVLQMHEEFLKSLIDAPGDAYVEHRIALNRAVKPCGFYDTNVWFRGVIDYLKVNGDHAHIIDHKTGKVHQKIGQLYLFAIWTFIAFPAVQMVKVQFYWTQTKTTYGVTISRDRLAGLWTMFVPDLRQYAEAFHFDTWQPRPSGLCKRHCPVTSCEFNGAKK